MDKHHKELLDEIREQLSHRGHDTTTANSRVLIIDGLNTFIRAFASVPVLNDDGMHIGGISGFLRSVGYAIEVIRPTRVIIVFDGKGGSVRRKKLFPEYKERRSPNVRINRTEIFSDQSQEEQMMRHELLRIVEYLSNMPVLMFSLENVEADDVIAYVATHVLTESKITIMSADKDFLQLVDTRVEVWSPTKKKIYTPELVQEEYGIYAQNICLFRAISGRGDKSDNITGIRGFGEKTIVKKFPMLQENRLIGEKEIFDHAKSFINKPNQKDLLYQRLCEHKDIVERNIKLMQLKDVDISASAKSKVLEGVNRPIPTLNRYNVLRMVMEDKLYAAFPNMEVWLREKWNSIDHFALLSHKKETT